MTPPDTRRGWLARQLGTLALSHVQGLAPTAPVRSAAWHNALGRLGLHLPLFVVHDLGLLLTSPRLDGSAKEPASPAARSSSGVAIGPRLLVLDRLRLSRESRALLRQYQSLLEGIAASEVIEKAASWRLRDELVTVLLARVLGDLYLRWSEPTKAIGAEPLPLDPAPLSATSPDELAANFLAFDTGPVLGFVRYLVDSGLSLYTAVEQIDLETLRLLGVLGGGAAGAAGALDLVDLYAVFENPEASDVVHFSIELLPSVLETKRASGAQAFAVDGYASIERKGSPDSMLLTEFAWDAEHFERKVADDELYYYGRERQREEQRRLQYVLVDSSPSMRGVRQVFARGLALALVKKLGLQGDEVWLRFFDSRLHDPQKAAAGAPGATGAMAPYVLGFRSERGRNYGRVFRQLLVELARLRREERRHVVLYIVTHGQCHLPVDLVEQLRRQAYLFGIFILPSSEVRLEYLELLDHYQIVDGAALASRTGRKNRALDILAQAGTRG